MVFDDFVWKYKTKSNRKYTITRRYVSDFMWSRIMMVVYKLIYSQLENTELMMWEKM